MYRLVVSCLLPGDLIRWQKVLGNDTSGHSVRSFGQSRIPYGQSDLIRLSFFDVSCSVDAAEIILCRPFWVNTMLIQWGGKDHFPHANSAHTAMTSHVPSLWNLWFIHLYQDEGPVPGLILPSSQHQVTWCWKVSQDKKESRSASVESTRNPASKKQHVQNQPKT